MLLRPAGGAAFHQQGVDARDYGLAYGIVTVMMALATGWFASIVFRRD